MNAHGRGLFDRLFDRLRRPGLVAGAGPVGLLGRAFRVERDDLLTRCTREEVESHERLVDPLGAAPSVPFGHLHPLWQRLLQQLRADDELWRFHAQRMAIDGAAEIRTGYAIVRGGRPVDAMVTSVRALPADPQDHRQGRQRDASADLPASFPPSGQDDRSSQVSGAEAALPGDREAARVE